jgi:Mg2+ and Co2+ transporter CorA
MCGSLVFNLHLLTPIDIQIMKTHEKLELFGSYYLASAILFSIIRVSSCY